MGAGLVAAAACGDDQAGPDPGTAVADFYVAIQDQTLEVDAAAGVLANDGEGASAVAEAGLVTRGLGVAAVADDGAFAYTPAAGRWGVDGFTYAVQAPGLPPSRAEVRIMILPAPLALGELLGGGQGWLVDGPVGERLGAAMVGLADVDGDDLDELLLAAPDADAAGIDAGRAYLLRGGDRLRDPQDIAAAVELAAAGDGGLILDGEAAGDRLGSAVASGDLDGDGLGDLVLCAPHRDLARADAGRCYVIFGRRLAVADVDLARVVSGDDGFVIDGEGEAAWTGLAAASGADLNNDGLDDLLIGAPGLAAPEREQGRAYVVFGRSGGARVDLAEVAAGVGGYAITGQAAYERAGAAVALVGDLDGDSLGDLAVAAPLAAVGAADQAGLVYMVYGQGFKGQVRASLRLGDGQAARLGASLAALGDFDGDGRPDLAVGAPDAKGARTSREGEVFVVFGRALAGDVDLAALAAAGEGLRIRGERQLFGQCGLALAPAGDLDGDGRADLLIGAPSLDLPATPGAGRAYVVLGRGDGGVLDLADVAAGVGGFAIDGAFEGGAAGQGVAAPGDVDGDALLDLLIAAPTASTRGAASGRVALVFGFGAAPPGP